MAFQAGAAPFQSAEDKYPGQMVWYFQPAFNMWFIIPADSSLKRTINASCVRRFTDYAPPVGLPPG